VEIARRKRFTELVAGLAFTGLPAEFLAIGKASESGAGREAFGPASLERFPNVLLRTQDDKAVRFYDDLLKGKVVLINFFFTSCSNNCPRTTANLSKVQELFGDHFGRDVVMLSISIDPTVDTPSVLKKYAAAFHPKPGWYFLTGQKMNIDQIRRKLGVYDSDADKTNHTGVLIYGNETLGSWTATHVMLKPEFIAKSVSRLIITK